jgi:hypothetical protein
MDLPSLTQLESFWPDVAAPFDEIVPNGCQLARTEDEWRAGEDAIRRRRVELVPLPGSPALDELLEEAHHDAFRHGWTPVDHRRFEHENVILTLETIEDRIAAEFLQPWPPAYGPPVETSEMFQNLVRRLLRLGADPMRLEKRVKVSPTAIMTADQVEETVEMPCEEALESRISELAFRREAGEWISEETTATHAIVAWVRKDGGWVRVRMRKSRNR